MQVQVQPTGRTIGRCPICGRQEISVGVGTGQMMQPIKGFQLIIAGSGVRGLTATVCQLCITTIHRATAPHAIQRTPPA